MIDARPYTPEQPPMGGLDVKAEYDRLYLEKCQEVNRLEQKVERYKSTAEIAVKQKGELREQLEDARKTIRELEHRLDSQRNIISVIKTEEMEYIDTIKQLEAELDEAKQTIRELAAEQLPFGFFPDAELPEELPEELAEGVPLWAFQPVTAQDILCLSSALKNLYEIHKCDSWLLYTKLSRVLEKLIDAYSNEEG